MRRLPVILALTTLLAAAAASAQTAPLPMGWKWRDASGQIHVSDLPPPSSVPTKDILERPPLQRKVAAAAAAADAPASAASASGPRAPSRVDPELEARRKRATDEQSAQQRQAEERNASAKAENCQRARVRMAALNDGLRLTRPNAQGELEILDDKGRAEEIQRARAVIASDCR